MRDMYVPVGFRFNPSEEEVIRGFLYPKVTGLPLPWDGVKDRCLYGAEPWNVFFDADRDDMESSHCWQTKKEGGSVKKTIYVFTSITKSSPNAKDSKRAARIAGCGTWSGQTGPKDITHSDTGEIIGYSRMLTFKIKKDSAKKINDQDSLLGHWIMHEYTLSDSTLRMAGLTHNDIVLCKITRIIKNQNKNKKRSPDQIFHQTAAAAEDVLQYYSPENNIITNTAAEGESYCSAAEGDEHANNNKRSRVGQEEEIHQTAIPAEEVQYYYPENNTVQIHQMEAPPEEEVHYYSPGNNTVQIHQTAVPAEEVQYYYPENNTVQIHQMEAPPEEEVHYYSPGNNTVQIHQMEAPPEEEVHYYSPGNNTVQIHQTAVPAEEVQYYYPENNTVQIHQMEAPPEEEVHYYSPGNNTVQIHQTAVPAEEVQYYYPENNTVQIHQMETPPEEEVHYYSPGNNTVQIHQTVVPAEEVQFYYPENNTVQIHQTAAGPTEEVQCYFPENSTDEIEKNIYDLPYVDFGDLWQECQ